MPGELRDLDWVSLVAGLTTVAGVALYLTGAGREWIAPAALILVGVLAVATAFRQDHQDH